MKNTTYQIIAGLFAVLSSLSAEELVEVSAISKEAAPGFDAMPYTMRYTEGDQEVSLNVSTIPIVKTSDIENMTVGEDPLKVDIQLSEEGRKKMVKGTTGMQGKQLAVIIEGRIQIAPFLHDAPLGRNFVISGFTNAAEAAAFVDKYQKKKDNKSEMATPRKPSD